MKTNFFLLSGLLLLLCIAKSYSNENQGSQRKEQSHEGSAGTLNVVYTQEMGGIASEWANAFGKTNPGLTIHLDKFAQNVAAKENSLNLVSGQNSTADQSQWKMVIGHDVLVPVINSKNPMLAQLLRQGVSAERLAQLMKDPSNLHWGKLADGGQNTPLHFYLVDNQNSRTLLANFTRTEASAIKGIMVASDAELISAVQQDIHSLGFGNLSAIIKQGTFDLPAGVCLLPVDKNGNGRIDRFESIYESPQALVRGAWIGKYPASLRSDIFVTAASKPKEKEALAFIEWILAEGQQFLVNRGSFEMAETEIQSNLASLNMGEVSLAQSEAAHFSKLWIILTACVLVAGVMASAFARYLRKLRSAPLSTHISITPSLNENSIAAPAGIYYDKSHTWAFMEKDGKVKVGIDDFMQHVTGTLTRIKMKEKGEKVRKGEKVMTLVHEGKQLTLHSPVSGTIIEQNPLLAADSSLLNTSPYSEGWVYLIEPINWSREIQFMFRAEKYKEWLKGEFTRLKDFFTASVMKNTSVFAHVILQDGGEITDHILADLGPEIWEDFQEGFIDISR